MSTSILEIFEAALGLSLGAVEDGRHVGRGRRRRPRSSGRSLWEREHLTRALEPRPAKAWKREAHIEKLRRRWLRQMAFAEKLAARALRQTG